MSYGIKVFNSSGGTVFDSTHSLGRVIGRINEGNTLRVKNGKAVIIPYFSQFYEVST